MRRLRCTAPIATPIPIHATILAAAAAAAVLAPQQLVERCSRCVLRGQPRLVLAPDCRLVRLDEPPEVCHELVCLVKVADAPAGANTTVALGRQHEMSAMSLSA